MDQELAVTLKKTIKKLDNNVCKALTQVCEYAKHEIEGFEWLTHTADYANFPHSLLVTCVFDTNKHLNNAVIAQNDVFLIKHIQQSLLKQGIVLKKAKSNVRFDTEEDGASERLL
jgi:hypothetical protein